MGTFHLPKWVFWLNIFATPLTLAGLGYLLEKLKKKHLERAGHGIGALESIIKEADRTVMADTFEIEEPYFRAEVPWTRVRVRHTGKVPCVMEVVKGNAKKIRLFDKSAYIGWKKQQKDLPNVPNKVKIEGRKVPTAYPKEMIAVVLDKADHIFDDADMAQVRGIVRIEPRQVLFLQKGDFLKGEYLTMVTNLLLRLASKTEKECK